MKSAIIDVANPKLLFEPPPLGTVLYFNGLPGHGDTVKDKSPYCNNGTRVGASWRRHENGIWYLYFDGIDDKVTTGKELPHSGSFTIVIWIKNDAAVVSLERPCGKVLGNGVDIAYQFYSHDAPFLCLEGDLSGVRRIDEFPNDRLTWTRLAWINDSGINRISVNGSISNTRTVATGPSYGGAVANFTAAFTSTGGELWEIGGERNGARFYNGNLGLHYILLRAIDEREDFKLFEKERRLYNIWL